MYNNKQKKIKLESQQIYMDTGLQGLINSESICAQKSSSSVICHPFAELMVTGVKMIIIALYAHGQQAARAERIEKKDQ